MARSNHLRASAVGLGVETGDRLDRLERRRPDSDSSSSGGGGGTNWITWSTGLASGDTETVGRILFLPGASRLTISASFQTGDDVLVTGQEIGLDGLDPDSSFGGGFGGGPFYFAEWIVLVSVATAVTVSIFVETDDASAVSARGCVIVEPLPSTPG